MFKCDKCKYECETAEIEIKDVTEFWGQVYCIPQYELRSLCCGAYVNEEELEEDE
jgi:hypothetical protein